jgi:CHAT domain-containing protein
MCVTFLIGLSLLACGRERSTRSDEQRAGFSPGRLAPTSASKLFARLDWGTRRSERQQEMLAEIVREARRFDDRAIREGSGAALHEAGVFRLLLGKYDEAVGYLEEAVGRGGGVAASADLAAAFLARGEADLRPMDYVRAVSLAEGPSGTPSLALRINSSLALQRLGLRREAARRLESCLAIETDPAWRSRIRHTLDELQAPTLDHQWPPVRNLLTRRGEEGDFEGVADAVHRFPFRARLLGEEALGRWAAAEKGGESRGAAAWLTLAARIGQQLAADRGETLLEVAARSILESLDDTEARHRFVEAHLAYFRGLERFDGDDTSGAKPYFERSAELFVKTASPFALWAALYAIHCDYYSNAATALDRFGALYKTVDAERYPALAGRLCWLLGSASKTRSAYNDALKYYRRAHELLERAAGPAQSAFIHVLIAETLHLIGDDDAAWRERAEGMAGVARAAPPRRVVAMLLEAAWALAEAGADSMALLVLDELRRTAEEIGEPFHLAAAYLYQGLTLARLERPQEALMSLDRAREAVERIPPGPLRDGFTNRMTLARGLALRREDPRRALDLLAEAMARESAIGQEFYRVHAFLAEGEARRDLGEVAAARTDFLAAVDAYEATRGRLEELDLRLSAAKAAQKALETVLTLAPSDAAPEPESFVFAERLRARELLDRIAAWSPGRPTPPTAIEVARALAPENAVVHYTTLPDRILCWVLRHDGARGFHLAIGRAELQGEAHRARSLLELKATEEALRAPLSTLRRILFSPIEQAVAGAKVVIFIPDRELSAVPFAALYDSAADRYLIEDYVIATVPSAILLHLHGLDRRPRAPGDSLIVGVGTVPRDRLGLSPLKDVAVEIRGVAAEHVAPTLLTEEEATPASFLAHLAGKSLVHFAGHALVNSRRPEASILVLHPAPGEDDGGVTISAALAHGLAEASLVILPACRTMDQELDDRETPLGAAGLLYAAGIPAIVAGRLDVEDSAASLLMPSFHRALGPCPSSAESRPTCLQ